MIDGMAMPPPTSQADIERLWARIRTDRDDAQAEVKGRLEAPELAPAFRHQLLLIQATGHLEAGELAAALSTARTVLNWALAQGDALLAGRSHNLLGLMYWRLGDSASALDMFAQARKDAETAGEARLTMQATSNMGLIHGALKQWEQAVKLYRATVEQAERLGETRLTGISVNNLATALWEWQGPGDEALALARRAFAIKLQVGDKTSTAQTANNIAGILRDRHDYAEARSALAEAETRVREAGAKPPAFYLALNRAEFLTDTGNPWRDDAAGFTAFDEAVALAREIGMLDEEARAHERGDHARAYAHLEQCVRLREQHLAAQSARQIENLRQAYELDRLERAHRDERARREELENLNARLERTARERDSLLRLVGHDLRTHVGGMVGLGELVAEALPTGGEARDNAGQLVSLGLSTLGLLREIMEYGSALDGAFAAREDVDLAACVHDAQARLEPQFAAKRQTLAVELPARPVVVRANRAGVGRIVENLLTNAVKFSPLGAGTVLRLAETAGGWELAVVDHGQGIPPAEVSRLFHPNLRLSVKPTAGEPTTGLGLLLVHDIASMIGVTLAHEPTPGGGATFVIRFPARAG